MIKLKNYACNCSAKQMRYRKNESRTEERRIGDYIGEEKNGTEIIGREAEGRRERYP